MKEVIRRGQLAISEALYLLVRDEIAPGTGVDADQFFSEMETILLDLTPLNLQLLQTRLKFQTQIDAWLRNNKLSSIPFDSAKYCQFLEEIGYIVPEGPAFQVATKNVDDEIAKLSGPQLVVPVSNARFCTNATNARWGSLYDALYGASGYANVLPEDGDLAFGKGFNPIRGQAVIRETHRLLDQYLPLVIGHYDQVVEFVVATLGSKSVLNMKLENGTTTGLKHPAQWLGQRRDANNLCLLFEHHGLKMEFVIDRGHPIGKTHKAGLADVQLESALTTIQDFEDSVSAVNDTDKVCVYRNWNGLMLGNLTAELDKPGERQRRLNPDRQYQRPDAGNLVVAGRSLLLARNVGLHMMTQSITIEGRVVPEGIVDCMVSCLSALHDLRGKPDRQRNSRRGSIYIVKPKLHGPEEVRFTVNLFARVEKALKLPEKTIKLGLMDEEQRTSLNLRECIREASERLFFINTGFLDRTGDLLHTQMEAGLFETKAGMKSGAWMQAYEDNNVIIGLQTGLNRCGQIGKGMWAENRNCKGLLQTKKNHPLAGANTAWVPSPTMATLHVLHYHEVDVETIQQTITTSKSIDKARIIDLPLLMRDISNDLPVLVRDCVQSILGYVVRWVDAGIGCSSVPDMRGTYLMEDRATLRIGSQLLANWLLHGLVSEAQIDTALREMAAKVDEQNADQPGYMNMAPKYDGIAFTTARSLILEGKHADNGYVEPLLHGGRLKVLGEEIGH